MIVAASPTEMGQLRDIHMSIRKLPPQPYKTILRNLNVGQNPHLEHKAQLFIKLEKFAAGNNAAILFPLGIVMRVVIAVVMYGGNKVIYIVDKAFEVRRMRLD